MLSMMVRRKRGRNAATVTVHSFVLGHYEVSHACTVRSLKVETEEEKIGCRI